MVTSGWKEGQIRTNSDALMVAIDFLDAWLDQFDEDNEDYQRNVDARQLLGKMLRRQTRT